MGKCTRWSYEMHREGRWRLSRTKRASTSGRSRRWSRSRWRGRTDELGMSTALRSTKPPSPRWEKLKFRWAAGFWELHPSATLLADRPSRSTTPIGFVPTSRSAKRKKPIGLADRLNEIKLTKPIGELLADRD